MNSKFENFPEVYVVSFISAVDRRTTLEEQFSKYGISNVNSLISLFVLDWWKNNQKNDINELALKKHYDNNLEFNR